MPKFGNVKKAKDKKGNEMGRKERPRRLNVSRPISSTVKPRYKGRFRMRGCPLYKSKFSEYIFFVRKYIQSTSGMVL